MRSLQFSRPKGPGFGISKAYYLSVLSSKPVMPPILALINPKQEGGAIEGFGAPLMPGVGKDFLSQPMIRGAYALASKDRKTVIKMLVLSKEEAGFDPEPIVRSRLAETLDPEIIVSIRSTWMLAQLTFESHDPGVFAAIHFHLQLASRLARLTEGVVADPIAQRYLLPNDVVGATSATSVCAPDLVTIHSKQRPDGYHVFTLGMQKFALPELEIVGIDPQVLDLASRFLLGMSQSVLNSKLLYSGAHVGDPSVPFELREGGLDRGLWEGIPVLELLPPTRATATDALEAWQRSQRP